MADQRETPLYGRLDEAGTASDWLQCVIDQGWPAASSPTVLISYSREDRRWVKELERWLTRELEMAKCPETGQPYRTWHYADRRDGTAQGAQFTVELAKQLWGCRAAIVILSQDFVNSAICYDKELPFLVWRHVAHKMPLYVLHAGVFTSRRAVVPVPQIGGSWPDFQLLQQTSDHHPGLNPGLANPAGGKLLAQLRKGPQRDQRLKSFAAMVGSELAVWHPTKALPPHSDFGASATNAGTGLPSEDVGAFPNVDLFEGRARQRDILAAYARQASVAIAGLCQIGGQGKTALALKFIKDLQAEGDHRYEGVFRFMFYGGRTQAEFATALTNFLVEKLNEPPPLGQVESWLGETLRRRSILLLLDGVEVIQSGARAADAGSFQHGPMKALLFWLCQSQEIATFAVLTSRLPFRDLERYRGTRFMPVELGGLDPEDGVKFLRRLGLYDNHAVLAQYVADLSGHPLGLLIFANSAHRMARQRGNAAATVARKANLAAPGTMEEKLNRILDYYRKGLTRFETALLAAATVFPDGASVDWVRRTMNAEGLDVDVMGWDSIEVRRKLDHMAQEGVLQIVPDRAQVEYTAHPIIRQYFRADPGTLSQTAAQLQIADRPPSFLPRTLAQARGYLRAIEIHTENGDFAAASRILEYNLTNTRVLTALDGWPEAFQCLWQFFQPDRRAACKEALGVDWWNATLFTMISVCINLHEWSLAEEFFSLDTGHPADSQLTELHERRVLQAKIEAEIGSIEEASKILGALLDGQFLADLSEVECLLAELERRQGLPRRAMARLRIWHQFRPRTLTALTNWLSNWNGALTTVASALARSDIVLSKRYCDAVDKALPLAPKQREILAKIQEYRALAFRPRDDRNSDDWARMLELARDLAASAGRLSIKGADGGWVVAVVIALNGLGRPREANDVAEVAKAELHERSWRRLSVELEIARARFLLGESALASLIAEDVRGRAFIERQMLIARDAAELLLEILPCAPDPLLQTRAHRTLEWVQEHDIRPSDVQPFGVLPGESGWDEYASGLLLESVDDTAPNGDDYSIRDLVQADKDSEITLELDAALSYAAELGLAAAIPVLLKRGARVRNKSRNDQTPLCFAVRGGHTEIIAQLIEKQGGVDLSDHLDAGVGAAIAAGSAPVLQQLLNGAVNITAEGRARLCVAVARGGDEELMRVVLDFGADPMTADQTGSLPIVAAAGVGNLAVVEFLGQRVPLTSADSHGRTALMAAAERGYTDIIDRLADFRVDVSQKDNLGRTAFDIAADAGKFVALSRLASRYGVALDQMRHIIDRAINMTIAQKDENEIQRTLMLLELRGDRSLAKTKNKLRVALKAIVKARNVELSQASDDLNIGLVVNERGKMCLVYDREFEDTPLWVAYHVDKKQIEIVFDTGGTYPINWEATDEMHVTLLNIDKILIIRMEDKKPVEGFDTSFLRLLQGKVIEDERGISSADDLPNEFP